MESNKLTQIAIVTLIRRISAFNKETKVEENKIRFATQ